MTASETSHSGGALTDRQWGRLAKAYGCTVDQLREARRLGVPLKRYLSEDAPMAPVDNAHELAEKAAGLQRPPDGWLPNGRTGSRGRRAHGKQGNPDAVYKLERE